MKIEDYLQEFDSASEHYLAELYEFLRIPSISSENEFVEDVLRCSKWVANFLSDAGFKVRILEGAGHPVVFAERFISADLPTLMFYQHYDVQPVDPISEWVSPPFEPTVREGEIYCRGAQDNKGQCYSTLAALRYLLKNQPDLPINLKVIVEGEEETGSEVLTALLKTDGELFRSDAIVIPDFGIRSLDHPSITLGTRGMISFTLKLSGSSTDLHSGMLGGVAYNPNRAMTEILGALVDSQGRVAIPGFYDDVKELTNEEKDLIDWSFDHQRYKKYFGSEAIGGEIGFSPYERAWIRPTLEINGINGGYTGSGFKTVIPAQTIAKISCRLVPDQDPTKVAELVRGHILSQIPPGIECDLEVHAGAGRPLRTSYDTRISKVSAQAISEACGGKHCGPILSGGSIPVISELARVSGGDTVFMGYGFDTDQIHAPNEHYGINRIRLGFATIGRMVELFSVKA